MARTHRNAASSHGKSNSNDTAAGRRSQISHALSKLLRHQAENEKIRITPAGWVRMDDLLAWRGLSRMSDDLTVSDIFDVVEEDGKTGKGRFGLKVVAGSSDTTSDDVDKELLDASFTQPEDEIGSIEEDGAATGEMVEATSRLSFDKSQPDSEQQSSTPTSIDPNSKNGPETQLTIQHHLENPETPASHYLIRATQGHTIRSVGSVDLLTPVTLDDPSSIPSTVVHGTFYGAWPRILSSGGLKSMGRNNVHFATGPSLEEVVSTIPSDPNTATSGGLKTKTQVDSLLSREKVISGMRWDAQILIYVDLKRCLEDIAAQKLDMTWWKSDNGVILTEGVIDNAVASTKMEVDSNTHDSPLPNTTTDNIDQGQGEGEVLIVSEHAKAQKHRENLQQQNESHPELPGYDANQGEGGEVLVASREAKMQKHQENMEDRQRQQQSLPVSTTASTSQAQDPQQEEPEVIIASKHAKTRKHLENVERQSAETPQPQSQPPPQQQQQQQHQEQQQEPERDIIIASKHAKEQRHQENIQHQNQHSSTEVEPDADTDPNPEILIASKHAKERKHLENIQHQQQPPPPDPDPEILLASSHAKAQKHRENTHEQGPRQEQRQEITRLVPMRYVTHAIEIKAGLGVLWQRDRGGLVKELPENLASAPVPRGKDRGSRARGGRGRGGGGGGGGKGKGREGEGA